MHGIARRNALVLGTILLCSVPLLYRVYIAECASYRKSRWPQFLLDKAATRNQINALQSNFASEANAGLIADASNTGSVLRNENGGDESGSIKQANSEFGVQKAKMESQGNAGLIANTAEETTDLWKQAYEIDWGNTKRARSKPEGKKELVTMKNTAPKEITVLPVGHSKSVRDEPPITTLVSNAKVEIRIAREEVNKWSHSWPHVNIGNCSHAEYMNKGINSNHHQEALHYPLTGLVSFPGSGNTWTRYLIRRATGFWTGSIYTDRSLLRGGFRAELDDCMDGGTVVIKAHYPTGPRAHCKFERAVIVIRDPHRAVLSEFNWRSSSSHTGVADPRLFRTKLWMDHVIHRTDKWTDTTMTWIEKFHDPKTDRVFDADSNPFVRDPKSSKKLLLVSYERIKNNPTREMQRVVEFLGLKEFRKDCVETDRDGNFRRDSALSESIECLFRKFGLKDAVEKRIDRISKRMIEIGIGNISAEFEGPGGSSVSDKCKFL